MGIESPVHLIFIGVVALLVLGPKRLPEVARALGHGLREFREAINLDGEQPIEHAPVASQPVVDPEMAQYHAAAQQPPASPAGPPPVAQSFVQPAAPVDQAGAAAPAQGDPLADSFERAQPGPTAVDPAWPVPSPDSPDSRQL